MNIVVLTASGKTITRPSTTLEKNGNNLYLPEYVSALSASPALMINISRPGRGIAEKFAGRYADSLTFGCLLYPENLIDGSPEGFACASCLDHTTHTGAGSFPVCSAGMSLKANGESLFGQEAFDTGIVARAIAEVSRFVFIRTGDILAVEMAPRQVINLKKTEENTVQAFFGGKTVLDFKVIV